MKLKVILIWVLGFCCLNGLAQEKVFFVTEPENARWSYKEMDGDGNTIATVYHSVETMKGDAVNGSVKLRVEKVRTASPADTLKSYIFYRFKDGEYMVDMNAIFEEDVLESILKDAIDDMKSDVSEEKKKAAIEEMKSKFSFSGEVRGIPRYPKTGPLPDYEFQFKFSVISVRISGEDRKITGKETLHTPAGDFDCFIMEETITSKALMQKDVEKTVSWYAYGIGLVKQLTYDKKGELQSATLLDSQRTAITYE